MQLFLYFLGFMTTALSILTGEYDSLQGIDWLEMVMLILPIIVALLGTIGTRLRQQQKYSVCKMASYEIVAEVYKFRVRAMEYDSMALAAYIHAQQTAGQDKKKDEGELVPPISSGQKNKLARQVFVQKVQDIYTKCMLAEMTKGTSITHKSNFGMDPARLLRGEDTGPDESEKETRAQLERHVANRLYFLNVNEWKLGVDTVKAKEDEKAAKRRAALNKKIKMVSTKLFRVGATAVFYGTMLSIQISGKVLEISKKWLGKGIDAGKLALPKVPNPPPAVEVDEEEKTTNTMDPTAQKIANLKEKWNKVFNSDNLNALASVVTEDKAKKAGEKTLDTTYVDPDEESDDDVEDSAGAGGDGGARCRDDFFSSITIDDYMKYRAKPVLAYLEKTAPWRGFWMQTGEVLIFVFSSSGAVLVAANAIPFVALTVACASIMRSFLEFSNLPKQVEAYNTAFTSVHNLLNRWDGLTRTERRNGKTIKQVVTTVEQAMQLVAIALTDALPAQDDSEDGDGDGDGDKEE